MKKGLVITLIVLIAALGVGGWKFHDVYAKAKNSVPNNTTINGIDCSGLNFDEAKAKLTEEWNKNTFIIRQDGKEIGKIEKLDLEYDIDDQLRETVAGNPFKTVYDSISKDKKEFVIKMTPTILTKGIEKKIDKFKFLKTKAKTKTQDAYVDLSNTDFKIVKEVYGDNIDRERFEKKLEKKIAKGDFELDYKAEDYYDLPEYKSEDEALLKHQEWCQENLTQKITYNMYDGSRDITPSELYSVYTLDGKALSDLPLEDVVQKTIADFQVDKKKVKKVVNGIAWDYNTAFFDRRFKTQGGDTVTVSGGDYGWALNQKKETKRLTEAIEKGEDTSLDPKWKQKPYYTEGGKDNDIGDSYVEVSITGQHVWLVKDGKVKVSTACTTGNPNQGHATPPGTYRINYMQRNTTLRGFNNDGSRYESDVSYWMPFNGGIGLHDATWRGSFGGTQYQSSGSHGCVNLPYSAAAEIFSIVEKGYPVVVYY